MIRIHLIPTFAAILAIGTASATATTDAYLFAHFTGESRAGEQIYFAVSEDGLNWTDLNSSAPVLISKVGEKGVRDPSLLRTEDGKFILLATDLRIASGKGWGTATRKGSTSLVFWESSDLVNWSEPWLVDVASSIPGAGCAWAPEAIHDDRHGGYFVYWATISPVDGVFKARIYGAHTKDFRTFTKPALYISRGDRDIIDTQIIEVEGAKHRYYRVSCDGQITAESCDSLLGNWEHIGDLSYLGYTGKQVEGPILFKFNGERKWSLFMDQYASGRGYLPFVTSDLFAHRGYQVLGAGDYALGTSHKRHGGILPITRAEFDALKARWPSPPAVRIAPAADGRVIRHQGFRLRLDHDVAPDDDSRWVLVPGLSGTKDTVSIRSRNFPNHFITANSDGVKMEENDGTPALAARASYYRTAVSNASDTWSFRLQGTKGLYLLNKDDGLSTGNATTEEQRGRAAFSIRR